MISQNSLFGQVSLVLVVYSKTNKSLQLASLNSFNLKSFILDALANLATLLEVVKAVLLGSLRIHANLVPVYIKSAKAHTTRSAHIFKNEPLFKEIELTEWFGHEL